MTVSERCLRRSLYQSLDEHPQTDDSARFNALVQSAGRTGMFRQSIDAWMLSVINGSSDSRDALAAAIEVLGGRLSPDGAKVEDISTGVLALVRDTAAATIFDFGLRHGWFYEDIKQLQALVPSIINEQIDVSDQADQPTPSTTMFYRVTERLSGLSPQLLEKGLI